MPIEPRDLVDLQMLAARLLVSRLTEYLEEAHDEDKEHIENGLSHAGDGDEGCSYCDAIESAKEWMNEFDG
jgi:hypothetical protein